ncbi:MAG TPA: hypothetical protein PKW79_07975 [Rhabdochlamydiaceae bacterium]|nr:hypothetical protein [Rhabdochlamydiaceae bacterium]
MAKKKTMYEKLPFMKARRLKKLGEEKGRIAERKDQIKLRTQELEIERKSWDTKLKNEADKRRIDTDNHNLEIRFINEKISEMRKVQAEQIKLFREIYQGKGKELEKLIKQYREKIEALDARNQEINDFLSKHVARMAEIKKHQELRIIDNSRDSLAMEHVRIMEKDYQKLVASGYNSAFTPPKPARETVN